MRNIKTLLLLFSILCFGTEVLADAICVDGIYYNINQSEKTAEVTRGNYGTNTTCIVIPASFSYQNFTYTVTSIGQDAFSYYSKLTSVYIPNTVTSIGKKAFYSSGLISFNIPNTVTSIGESTFEDCRSLASVNIPNSVTSFGKSAFKDCRSLTSVNIPNSVTSIGDNMFYRCYGLTSVNIPNSVTSIGNNAFHYCAGLTAINIPNSVTSIGAGAFSSCSKLTSINIPNSVTSIESATFYECTGLTSIDISNSVTSIADQAFYSCTGLTSIDIPNSVTSIGNRVFMNCTGLTAVNISNSVTSIGGYVFSGCTGLTAINVSADNTKYSSVDGVLFNKEKTILHTFPLGKSGSFTIPNSMTSIGDHMFADCKNLTSINIPNTVTSIGNRAFAACTGLASVNIPNSVTSIGQYAFWGCTSLTSVYIPDPVTNIEENTFKDCSNLISVTIQNSVADIHNNAFNGCNNLTSINVSADNTKYSSVDGVLFNKDKTILYIFPKGKSGSFTIPNSMTSIGDYMFAGCKSLTSINIPKSVTSIGNYAFHGCNGLTSIEIPNSITSIGDYAFYNCSGLTSFNIPNSVTSIGRDAFCSCTGLTSIDIPNSVTSIGDDVFFGCTGLTAINVSADNANYSSVDGVLYNKDQTTLYNFPHSKSGTFSIPNTVTSIWKNAFYGCVGLTSVTIPNSVTSIGDYSFAYCTLKPIYLYAKLASDTFSYDKCFDFLKTSSVIYAYNSETDAISKHWSGTVVDIETPYSISVAQTLLCSVSFYVVGNESIPTTLQDVRIEGKVITPDENGLYTINGLAFNTSYDITVTYKTADGEIANMTKTVRAGEPSIIKRTIGVTQTTAKIFVMANDDESCNVTEKGVSCNGRIYECIGDTVIITGLNPGTTYSYTPFANYGMKQVKGEDVSFTTASMSPAIILQDLGPTSFTVRGNYIDGDASVSETGFTDHGSGNTLTVTGLAPNTSYTVNYYIKTQEGHSETTSATFKTPQLELTTLQPKCVSSSCAIVAATTNIGESETNVGFQWKKFDAPASLKPSEGYAAIYGGQLEGYIKNLQATSYYNVRAFYKSADGQYFYGDWVTFDPSDFSYFEPTVHTYDVTDVTASTAKVKGYVLAGTDNITEQGFEYRPMGSGAGRAQAVRVAAAEEQAGDDVFTVFATGQVMTAELRNLKPETTYVCRAFVKTVNGTTYGEEQTFTTGFDVTGIAGVEADAEAPTVEGYYDMSGRKIDTPKRGVNIIRYTDGTTRKVFVK